MDRDVVCDDALDRLGLRPVGFLEPELRERGRGRRVERLEFAEEIQERIQGVDRRDRDYIRSAFAVVEVIVLDGEVVEEVA